jgi:hypothetical protein
MRTFPGEDRRTGHEPRTERRRRRAATEILFELAPRDGDRKGNDGVQSHDLSVAETPDDSRDDVGVSQAHELVECLGQGFVERAEGTRARQRRWGPG